jgi:hypothetical protein
MVELGYALSSEEFPPEKIGQLLAGGLPLRTHFEKMVEPIDPPRLLRTSFWVPKCRDISTRSTSS